MNCKHVQELLPLFVGRDLEEKRAKLVTAHVQSCAECASSADEYRETRQLLQLFAPPPFSEALYDGLRMRVLGEIGRESTTPTLPQFVASLFRPRISWAVASTVLLAVSVFAFYFVADWRNDRQEVADTGRTVDPTTQDEQLNARSQGDDSSVFPSPLSKDNDGPTLPSTGRNTGADTKIPASVDRTRQSLRRKSPGAAADRTMALPVNTSDVRSMTAQASPEGNNLAEPESLKVRDPATSDKILRVEMQTKDRNIRIIWFSHSPTKQDSPSKSSKGI